MNLSETERAYLAGILDGEGHMSIQIGNGISDKCFPARVSVANNVPLIHDWLRERFGGVTQKMNGGRGRCSQTRWTNKPAIVKILEAALPYLIIKKRQAELMLTFMSSVDKPGGRNALPYEERLELVTLLTEERNKYSARGGE